MSGFKSGNNASKDVRVLKTTQKEARVSGGKSDIEESDVKEEDFGQGAVKSSNARDVRGYSGKSYSSSSKKQKGKPNDQYSSKDHGTTGPRRAASSRGKIWEPKADRSGGLSAKQQSYGSLPMPGVTSEAATSNVAPAHGGVYRADTHTGGVLHVNLAARQPKRAISEGGVGRRVVEKDEEEGEGRDFFRRLNELEERLGGSTARWNGKPASFGRVEDICVQLQEETRRCLWAHGLRTFLKSDLCGRLWRAGHHPVVEGLRRALAKQASPEDKDGVRDTCLRFLDMASLFYREVMSELQKRLKFTVPELLDPTRTHSSEVLCAKVLCHQLYLALGDLARYAEQVKERPDWAKARSYYSKAQQLMPKNGKSYNQLAVIAISAQRRLDAVYYNIRSLTAGTPFLGARESLLGLLHEAGSKVESPKKKKGGLDGVASLKKQDGKGKAHSKKKNPSGQKEAREVWVFPTRTLEEVKKMVVGEGLSQEQEGQLDVEGSSQHSDPLPELVDGAPSSELIKNTMKQFLTVHAKMYTKIGYDTLGQAVSSFLSAWTEYLTHRLTRSDGELFFKMAVINFFSIHNTSGDVSCQGRLRLMSVALSFLLEVTAVAVQCCLSRLTGAASSSSFRSTVQWDETPSVEGLSVEARASLFEVDHLLVQVKVSFDWLACQGDLWRECATQVDPSVWWLFWSHSADLLNKLYSLLPPTTIDQVALYEDRHLQGFIPLADALGPIDYTSKSPTPEESLKQCLQRASCLVARGRELAAEADTSRCHHHLAFNAAEQRFYSISKEEEEEEDEEEGDKETAAVSNSASEEEEEEFGIEGSTSPSSPVDGSIGLLRAELEELTKEVWEKEKAKERVKDYLTMQATEGCGKVFVFPKYLIPDTNGFIDHLPQLVQLVECGHFVLAVPLTVVEELEGITKGSSSAGQSKHDHSSSATHGAKEALSLLRGWFSSKLPSVRAATVKGELLTAMDYATVERMGGAAATNDDFILASCSSVNSRTSKTDIHITDVISMVVLLTADRNLRVKAHAAGVPVRDFPSFMAWVKPALKRKKGN